MHHEETARNVGELQRRVAQETDGRSLWISPPQVISARVESHWALSRFGVRFRNEDIARVAASIRALDAPHVDLFAALEAGLVTDDGLHLSQAGQQKIALEIVRGWSALS